MKKIAVSKKYAFAIALILCLAIACLVPSICFSTAAGQNAEKFELQGEIAKFYDKGTELALPNGNFVTQSGNVEAEKSLVMPNGTVTAAAKVTLDVCGRYTAVYKAQINGKICEKTYSFNVRQALYNVNSQLASAAYTEEYTFDNGDKPSSAGSGILVTLSQGSAFTYNKVFDLTGKTKDDVVFSANVISSKKGDYDAFKLFVRFTDAYDAANYVDVVAQPPKSNPSAITYFKAGAYNQTPTGAEWNNSALGYKLHVGDNYGNWLPFSMANKPSGGDREKDKLNISFDYAEKKVYGPASSSRNNEIIDLDNPAYFNDTLWEGFTTGECYVSVFAEEYSRSEVTLLIRSVFEDGDEAFKENTLTDEQGPNIRVDFGEYEQSNLPKAVIGAPYTVFAASAFDAYSAATLQTRVYYNYNTSSKRRITLDNGKFVPDETGEYTIEYTATDYSGNPTRETVTVDCVASVSFEIAAAQKSVAGYVGDWVSVPGCTVTGGSGNSGVSITAKCGETEYEIDIFALKFRPTAAGEYTVTYTATDYAGQVRTDTCVANVTAGNAPIFDGVASMPRYFVEGFVHKLPELSAVDYKDNAKTVVSEIYVSEDGGAEKKAENGLYTPSAGVRLVTVKYKAVGAFGENTALYENIPCRSVFTQDGASTQKIEKKNLFVWDKSSVTGEYIAVLQSNSTKYAVYTLSENAEAKYINKLPAVGYSLRWNTVSGDNLQKIHVTLTDAANPDLKIKLTYGKDDANASKVYLAINDGTVKLPLADYSFLNAQTTFGIDFDGLGTVTTANTAYNIATYLGGKKFEGFPSGAVYLDMAFEVTGETIVAVQSICNQFITDSTRDNTDPVLALRGEYKKQYGIGEQAEIFIADCYDAIQPYVDVTLTVLDTNGNIVTSADGELLENVSTSKAYSVALTQYGAYEVRYTEKSGGMRERRYSLLVVDRAKPVITVQSAIAAEYRAGDYITLSATAYDDVDGAVDALCAVVDSSGRIYTVNTGENYTFAKAGKYTVMFFAYDATGNYSSVSYTVTVK